MSRLNNGRRLSSKLFNLCLALLAIATTSLASVALAQKLTPPDVRDVANGVNESLPMRIDQDMELMNVMPNGMMLIYNIRYVNYPTSYFTAEELRLIKQESLPDEIRAACTNPRTVGLLEEGISIKYAYYAADGGYVWDWAVSDGTCDATAK